MVVDKQKRELTGLGLGMLPAAPLKQTIRKGGIAIATRVRAGMWPVSDATGKLLSSQIISLSALSQPGNDARGGQTR